MSRVYKGGAWGCLGCVRVGHGVSRGWGCVVSVSVV